MGIAKFSAPKKHKDSQPKKITTTSTTSNTQITAPPSSPSISHHPPISHKKTLKKSKQIQQADPAQTIPPLSPSKRDPSADPIKVITRSHSPKGQKAQTQGEHSSEKTKPQTLISQTIHAAKDKSHIESEGGNLVKNLFTSPTKDSPASQILQHSGATLSPMFDQSNPQHFAATIPKSTFGTTTIPSSSRPLKSILSKGAAASSSNIPPTPPKDTIHPHDFNHINLLLELKTEVLKLQKEKAEQALLLTEIQINQTFIQQEIRSWANRFEIFQHILRNQVFPHLLPELQITNLAPARGIPTIVVKQPEGSSAPSTGPLESSV